MSKFVCLSCHKEFKVAVRAPMSCPTKHLCQIVQSETAVTLSPPVIAHPTPDAVVTNVIRDDCSVPLPPLPPKSATRSTATLPNLGERKTTALPPAPVASPGVIKRKTVPLPTPTPVIPFAAQLVEKGQPPAVYPPAQAKSLAKSEVQPSSPDSESFALDDFVSNSATSTSHRSIPTTAEPVHALTSPVPVGTPPAILIVDGFQFPVTNGNILGREGDIARDLFRKDKTVGRIHARLDITPKNEITIRNLAHSGNPVLIDGRSLAFNQTAILPPGLHQLQLGTRFLCSINVTVTANQK